MKITRLIVAAFSLLLVAACSHKTTGTGAGAGEGTSYASVAEQLQNKGDSIFFAFDSSALTEESKMILREQAEFMKNNPDLKFIIGGYCDNRGTREYNMALGERRAFAVVNHLISLGVDSSRLTSVSYGKERPFVEGDNEAAWAQNRRAMTVVR